MICMATWTTCRVSWMQTAASFLLIRPSARASEMAVMAWPDSLASRLSFVGRVERSETQRFYALFLKYLPIATKDPNPDKVGGAKLGPAFIRRRLRVERGKFPQISQMKGDLVAVQFFLDGLHGLIGQRYA